MTSNNSIDKEERNIAIHILCIAISITCCGIALVLSIIYDISGLRIGSIIALIVLLVYVMLGIMTDCFVKKKKEITHEIVNPISHV